MTSIAEKIQQFYELKPAIEFPFLNRVEWTTVPLSPVPACERRLLLYLSKSPDGAGEGELVLEFQGVRNFQLRPESNCVVLEVRDASGRQWEGVNYEVREQESGTVSFICRDFSLILGGATP